MSVGGVGVVWVWCGCGVVWMGGWVGGWVGGCEALSRLTSVTGARRREGRREEGGEGERRGEGVKGGRE